MIRRSLLGAVLSIVLLGTGAAAGTEGKDAPERLYLRYCSACHGADGEGGGPLAELLQVAPTDLTRFAQKNGGVFPFRSVLRAMDGRTTDRVHGGSAMPVWGDVFSPPSSATMDEQLQAYGKMFLITFHIESLQVQD